MLQDNYNANPLDQRLIDKINSLEFRLENIENARQPYIGDWQELYADNFQYQAANTLRVTGQYTETLALGDKVRLTQSATTKYFYVVSIDQQSTYTDVGVWAGDDYTLTNNSITSLYLSRKVNPTGFPTVFDFTPSFIVYTYPVGSNTENESVNNFYQFWMIGPILYVEIRHSFDLASASPLPIYVTFYYGVNIGENSGNHPIWAGVTYGYPASTTVVEEGTITRSDVGVPLNNTTQQNNSISLVAVTRVAGGY